MLTNPEKGEHSFPHDAMIKDPEYAICLDASDCTPSGLSKGSPVNGKGGTEELAT